MYTFLFVIQIQHDQVCQLANKYTISVSIQQNIIYHRHTNIW